MIHRFDIYLQLIDYHLLSPMMATLICSFGGNQSLIFRVVNFNEGFDFEYVNHVPGVNF